MVQENTDQLTTTVRTRRRNKDKELEKDKLRQPNQIRLRREKCEEIKNRFLDNRLMKEKKVENIDIASLVS